MTPEQLDTERAKRAAACDLLDQLDCEAALHVMGWPLAEGNPLERHEIRTPCVANFGGQRHAFQPHCDCFRPTRNLNDAMLLVEKLHADGAAFAMSFNLYTSTWTVSDRVGMGSAFHASLPVAIVRACLAARVKVEELSHE